MARTRSRQSLARDDAERLVASLATWQTTRDAPTAELIDRLTASAVLQWVPPRLTASFETFQASWLRVLSSPVGRGWAIANVMLRLPAGEARVAALVARLRALIEAGPDPRSGQRIAGYLLAEQPAFTDTETSRLAEELVTLCRDDRVCALFASITAGYDGAVIAVVERVLALRSLAKPPARAPGPRASASRASRRSR